MGKKDVEALEITIDELPTYLHTNHAGLHGSGRRAVLPDRRERPATGAPQDTNQFNEKGHYVDCEPARAHRSPSSSSCPSATASRCRDLARRGHLLRIRRRQGHARGFLSAGACFPKRSVFCSYDVQEPRGVERMPRGLCYDALRTILAANNAATREEKEGIMAEECSHECSSCGVSGCGDRTAEAGPSHPGAQQSHQCQACDRRRVRQGRRGQVPRHQPARLRDEQARPQGGHSGRRHHRPVHSEVLWRRQPPDR